MQKKVKWGVIGAGGIADRRTIPGMLLADNAELVAVMDIAMDLAQRVAGKHNVPYVFDTVDGLLGIEEIEAVYIASPVVAHYEQAKKAALAGKHILIEKPLALTMGEGKELIQLCEERKLLFATGFMMRFHAHHARAKKLVAEGVLGDIVSVRAQLTCWYPDMPGNWRQSVATAGGGSLMDMGVHCIDILQYITGAKVIRVAALIGTKTFSYDVEDSASVLMQFSNGAYGYVDANFNIPDNAAECRLEIYGTKGSILADGTISQVEGGKFRLLLSQDTEYSAMQDRSGVDAELEAGADAGASADASSGADAGADSDDVIFGNMYTKEIESFGESVLRGTPVEVPAPDALQVQSVIECAYKSSKEGRMVEVPHI